MADEEIISEIIKEERARQLLSKPMAYEALCMLLMNMNTKTAASYLKPHHVTITSPLPFAEFLFLLRATRKLTVRGAIII